MAESIAVIGGGSWGTALARVLAERGPVRVWMRQSEAVESFNRSHENSRYLPGIRLPDAVSATADIAEAVRGAPAVVAVVPSHGMRQAMTEVARHISPDTVVISASKGIEQESLALMSDVLLQVLPEANRSKLAFLGGPSFAKEVMLGQPTAVSVASLDPAVAHRAQELFATSAFRVYSTDDVVGIEIGGAVKNVIAIAAGAADGLGFGHNTRAAIITRGLAEISRLALRKGANPLTLAGLSGLGDLVLTCTGDLSRNRTVGIELGKGRTIEDVLASMKQVAEGVRTTKSVHDLARKVGIEMPITAQVHAMLYGGQPAKEAVAELMGRALRAERG
ncbi:MAG: NAD(P)-dependent glycerol-3-phosphate dehydrogenase [Deltaproteobacteria bacterium]|nr:NAD(P)-dependent glycerol-3-phosphate dehydrogenase [Deltaproteobacteria bacterium]